MSGSSKQDPLVKGNPFAAAWDERARLWLVRSANVRTPDRTYRVSADGGDCDCDAPGPCWHRQIIPLADQVASVQASARSYYAGWRLADLRAEDARLHALLVERDTWFERAQLSVVGDEILDRLLGAEQAA